MRDPMSLIYWHTNNYIMVSGNTYAYRELLRQWGGQYQRDSKTWSLPRTQTSYTELMALIQRIGGKESPQPTEAPATPKRQGAELASQIEQALAQKVVAVPAQETALPVTTTEANTTSLSDLMRRVQRVLVAEFPRSEWIIGEIQNCKRSAHGFYLTLAEPKQEGSDQATVTASAVLWMRDLQDIRRKIGDQLLGSLLQDGTKVRALVQVSFYKDRGTLSLQIQDLDPAYTQGSMALQRQALVKELKSKGLYDANRAQKMPSLPLRIGLITADDSRAKSDFLHQLWSGDYCGEVIVYHAAMQGERLVRECIQGLEQLAQLPCDLIVLTRGGGSAADLRWFDSRDLALALAKTPCPVVAAIGHEDDVLVAEEVAFIRQKTPTAAAQYVLSLQDACRKHLDQTQQRLTDLMQRQVERHTLRLQQVQTRLDRLLHERTEQISARCNQASTRLQQAVAQRLATQERDLMRLGQALGQRALAYCDAKDQSKWQGKMLLDAAATLQQQRENKVHRLELQLTALDPKPWLEKGWTSLVTAAGERITSVKHVTPGQTVRARLRDGRLALTVNDSELATKENI